MLGHSGLNHISQTLLIGQNEMKELYGQLDKYDCLNELNAQQINQQIISAMKEAAVNRDKCMVEVQSISGKAISVIVSLMISLYEDTTEMELDTLLDCLIDSERLLVFLIFKESKSRKAFIKPRLTKETIGILKDTKIDEYLYGEQLSEKLKKAKAY